MANPTTDPREPRIERRDVLLWLGVLAGPFAWALQQQVSYMISPTLCAAGHRGVLHLVTLGALLIAAAGGAVAWHRWRAVYAGSTSKGIPEGSRVRFMALGGMAACVFFALVILATEIPNFVLRVCE